MVEFDASTDRRQQPRIDLLVKLQGELIALDERVHITQLDTGGMRVETTTPLSSRLPHAFRISDGEATVVVQGRVAHSRLVVEGDSVTYVAGVEFIDPSAAALTLIDRLIESSVFTTPGPSLRQVT